MRSKNDNQQPIALTIAGFDPTGGAGVIADIKTFAALNCYGLAATTAITVQDTTKVHSATILPSTLVSEQLKALFNDFKIDTVKIGMLASVENTIAVAEVLSYYQPDFIVLDPLIYSSSGYPLTTSAGQQMVCEKLFPLATLITPNLGEAAALTDTQVTDIDSMKLAAKRLHAMGAVGVLIKGGHLADEAIDLFYNGYEYQLFPAKRLVQNAHGTGCALAAAIAASLSLGDNLNAAITRAKGFITNALKNANQFGNGAALLDHFCQFKI